MQGQEKTMSPRAPLERSPGRKEILFPHGNFSLTFLFPDGSIQVTPFTWRTIPSPKILRPKLRKIRQAGIAYDRGELYENIFCLGAPLLLNGQVMGSISLTDTVDRINEKNFYKFARALKKKAEFISQQL